MENVKKLYKSKDDRMVSGVIGGIAEYFGIDSTLLRLIYVVALFIGIGSPVFLYIILSVLIPEPKNNGPEKTHADYNGYYKPKAPKNKTRKEAEKVEDDDWSDF